MKPKISNLLWGLLFIILGIGFAGNAFHLWRFTIFFRGWWTLFIIIPCFASILENRPNTGNVIGLAIGLMLLLVSQDIVPGDLIGKLLIPIVLIIIGLGIIFSNSFHWNFGNKEKEGPTDAQFRNTNHNFTEKHYTATFSGQNITCDNQVFEGAVLDAVFGSVCLRADQAIINEDVIIECNATFGGIEVYLPSDINIKVNTTSIFGGVSNRRHRMAPTNAPTVFITGTCMFGGVDLK